MTCYFQKRVRKGVGFFNVFFECLKVCWFLPAVPAVCTGDIAKCLGVDDPQNPSGINHGFLKAMLGEVAWGENGLSIGPAETQD